MMTKSKKFLMLLLTLLVSVVVNAQTKINGLYYNLNSETKEAEVTSEVYDNEYYTGDVVIPSTVTYDGVLRLLGRRLSCLAAPPQLQFLSL